MSRFALLGPHPEIGFSIGQHKTRAVGVAGDSSSPLQANPPQVGCTLNTLDFWQQKSIWELVLLCLKSKTKHTSRERKKTTWVKTKKGLTCSFSQGKGEWYSDWTVNEIKLKAEIYIESQILWELETHFCMFLCVQNWRYKHVWTCAD